jgi:predicted transcriptional regulator
MATLDSYCVRDYLTTELLTFTQDMEVMLAINQLVAQRVAGAPVLDGDRRIIGMLSERDCLSVGLSAAHDSCVAGPVSSYMSRHVETVAPDMNLTQLVSMFLSKPYRRYPVVEGGRLVGQISRSDVLRAISRLC